MEKAKLLRKLMGTLVQLAVLILIIPLIIFKKDLTNQELGIIVVACMMYLEECIKQSTEKQ